MFTHEVQIGAIDLVAQNVEGLNSELFYIMVANVTFFVLIFAVEYITLKVQARRLNTFINNNNNVQEDTMANANNQDQDNNTETTTSVRERIADFFENRRKAKIEKIEAKSKAKAAKLEAEKGARLAEIAEQIADLELSKAALSVEFDLSIISNGVSLAEKVEKAEELTLSEKVVRSFFAAVDERKAQQQAKADAKAAAEAAEEAERIRSLREEVGYFDLEHKMNQILVELDELKIQKDPTLVPEAKVIILKDEVAKLIAEAEAVLSSDRAGALSILRSSEIARKYKVPTNLNFVHTKKALLKLVA
jgi:hypothetical protein